MDVKGQFFLLNMFYIPKFSVFVFCVFLLPPLTKISTTSFLIEQSSYERVFSSTDGEQVDYSYYSLVIVKMKNKIEKGKQSTITHFFYI